MKDLDGYVSSLYELAQPQYRDLKKPRDEEILMDSLAARQMKFKASPIVRYDGRPAMSDNPVQDFKAQVTAIMLGGKVPTPLPDSWKKRF